MLTPGNKVKVCSLLFKQFVLNFLSKMDKTYTKKEYPKTLLHIFLTFLRSVVPNLGVLAPLEGVPWLFLVK